MSARRTNPLIAGRARLGIPPPAALRYAVPGNEINVGTRVPHRDCPEAFAFPELASWRKSACLTSSPPAPPPSRAAHARPRPAPRVPSGVRGRGWGRGAEVRSRSESWAESSRATGATTLRRVTAPGPALLWPLLPTPLLPPLPRPSDRAVT